MKVLMHGCAGKLGSAICDSLIQSEHTIVAGINEIEPAKKLGFPVYTDIDKCTENFDVIIDSSHYSVIPKLLGFALEKQKPVVICTTGIDSEIQEKIVKVSSEIAVLKSANTSLGINIISSLLDKMVDILSHSGFDIEIIEKHHSKKIDSPSGTALLLAEAINKAAGGKYEYVYDRSQIKEKRSQNEIGISSVRGGTIIGEHSIIFAGNDEVIEIKHSAYSKNLFAVGAVKAAEFLVDKKFGLYDMQDVIK